MGPDGDGGGGAELFWSGLKWEKLLFSYITLFDKNYISNVCVCDGVCVCVSVSKHDE